MLAMLNQWGLTAAMFVVAAVYVPGLFSAGNMPHWWAAAVLVPMVSWLDPRRVPLETGLLLLAGLSWAAISLAWTPIPAEGFGELILLIVLALVFLAAAGEERTDRLMVAACLGVSVSSVLSLLQWWGVEMNIPRAGNAGLFMNQEVLAEVSAPLLVWASWSIRSSDTRAEIALKVAMATLVAIPLLTCGSRIAVVAAAAGVSYPLWLSLGRSLKIASVAILAVLAFEAVVGLGIYKASTAATRLVLWGAGLMSLTPLGKGLGYWPVAFPGAMEEYAHSDPLQMAVELGLGSVFLLAIPVLILLKGVGDASVRAAFFCLCLEALVSFPLHSPVAAVVAACLAGGLAGRWADVRRLQLQGGEPPAVDLRRGVPPGPRLVHSVPRDAEGLAVRKAHSPRLRLRLAGLRRASSQGTR